MEMFLQNFSSKIKGALTGGASAKRVYADEATQSRAGHGVPGKDDTV